MKLLTQKDRLSDLILEQEPGVFYVPEEDIEEFCKIYSLEVQKINCENCNKELKMNLPSYCEGHACLEAPICECGTKANRIVFQPATKERKKFWSQMAEEIFY